MINGIGYTGILPENKANKLESPKFTDTFNSLYRKIEATVENGEIQVAVKDPEGEIIRYIPPIGLDQQIKLDRERPQSIDYYT